MQPTYRKSGPSRRAIPQTTDSKIPYHGSIGSLFLENRREERSFHTMQSLPLLSIRGPRAGPVTLRVDDSQHRGAV